MMVLSRARGTAKDSRGSKQRHRTTGKSMVMSTGSSMGSCVLFPVSV
jgi:hypothetical protein